MKNKIQNLTLILVLVGGLLVRVLGQLHQVFIQGKVLFTGTDDWYHIRLVEYMVANFPKSLWWDMYSQYPNGGPVGYLPMLHWPIALIGVLGLNYKVAAAWLPPIVGVLCLWVVYLTGKKLFTKGIGILAAFFAAFLPTEFLHRTLLGFYDNHCFEVLFLLLVLYFYISYTKAQKNRYIILAGLSLSCYLLNWLGGAFIFLLILVWYWLEFVLGLGRKTSTIKISLLVSLSAFVGTIISFPITIKADPTLETLLAGIVAIVLPLSLEGLKKVVKSVDKLLIILTLATPIGMIAVDIIYQGVWWKIFASFFWGFGSFIQEATPMSLPIILATYGLVLFLAIGGLLFCIRRGKYNLLLVTVSIILLIATIGQRRWNYYLAPIYAIFAAYFILEVVPKWITKEAKTPVVLITLVFCIASFLVNTISMATVSNSISVSWYNSMVWIKDNTPTPFPSTPNAFTSNTTDAPTYGILSWWDYGHWIIDIAQRVPLDSPTKASQVPANFLTSQTEAEALKALEGLNIQYIVIDKDVVEGKWVAVVVHASFNQGQALGLLQNSEAERLWLGQSQAFTLVHQEGDVKIFKRSL